MYETYTEFGESDIQTGKSRLNIVSELNLRNLIDSKADATGVFGFDRTALLVIAGGLLIVWALGVKS